MKTKWNLGLLYQNEHDPQIDRDIDSMVTAAKNFSRKWRKNDSYMQGGDSLLEAMDDYERLYVATAGKKPYYYFELITQIDSTNKRAIARLTQIRESLVTIENEVLFFTLAIGKIKPATQQQILADDRFSRHRYAFERVFLLAKYKLPEDQERLINSLMTSSYFMWTEGVEKALAAETVTVRGKSMSLGEAAWTIPLLPRSERRALSHQIAEKTKKVEKFSESEINAIFNFKKTLDVLRGHKHAYSEMILENENNETQILRLADLVTQHFPIAHRFYKLKKQLLGIAGKLESHDAHARIGTFKRAFDFTESVAIAHSAFEKVDPDFAAILDRFLKEGRIDAMPRPGKRAGAFCAPALGIPTFVMLNHVPSFDGLKTLAHEMGHAIHTEYSKSQPPMYQGYSLSTAETASTLFENFVFDEVFETLTDREKIIALHDRIQDALATIMRQIAGFNFERELHEVVRRDGYVPSETIGKLLNKHIGASIGPLFNLTSDNGLFWVRWSHIRSFFYVYTYAYGGLVSRAMYALYKQDKSFVEKIKRFLSAGGSDTPENIFKSIGIDTSKDEFWIAGLKAIEDDIIKLERLVKESKTPSKANKSKKAKKRA